MSNLKFSKNGVPMGRNKSQAGNNNSHWTEAEDNYIRLAVSEGSSVDGVAAKLGRTRQAVLSRKWTQGIKGRFGNPKSKKMQGIKTPIAPTVKNPSKTPIKVPAGLELFRMESNVPMTSRGSMNEESRNKIRNLFSNMNVGQSFVVPCKLSHVAKYIATKEFPEFKIRASATSQDKKFHRIFRVA